LTLVNGSCGSVGLLTQVNYAATLVQYDPSKTRGDLIMDVMRTRPMVILAGVLQINPFFVPPDQYLHELRGAAGGVVGFGMKRSDA
jgi:hypothetical protein